MEKKKKYITICAALLSIATLLLLGLTYAYYRTKIIENPNEQSISLKSKKLEVKYSDNNETLVANKVRPGFTTTKEFTVENTGSATASYSIILDNITNTFIRNKDWTFILKQGETILKSGVLPQTKSYIDFSEEIEAGDKIEYTLTINYLTSTEDQSIDMGKNLSLRINIANEIGTILTNASSGTLLSALANDNIISEPLTIPGQEISLTTLYEEGVFSPTTTEMSVYSYQADFWVYGTGYEFDGKTGKYNLTGVKIGKYSEIYNNLTGAYLISSSASKNRAKTEEEASEISVTDLDTIYKIETPSQYSLTYQSKKNNIPLYGEAVLSSTEDDNGETYYFRGNVENNYVTYSNMCWRIVRIQGDGSIKLVLADRSNPCGTENGYSIENGDSGFVADSSTQYFTYKFNLKYDASDFIYANSDIMPVLNAWAGIDESRKYTYYEYYHSGYDYDSVPRTTTFRNVVLDTSQLSTTPEWCNDTSEYNKNQYGEIIFGSYNRLNTVSATPTLKCDMNGATKYTDSAIGILTVDEVAFAGGAYGLDNKEYYLYFNAHNTYYWTMTPYEYSYYTQLNIVSAGNISTAAAGHEDWDIYVLGTIRPAVILKPTVTISGGNGKIDTPYTIN